MNAQSKTAIIKGKVTDEKQRPLDGASISIKDVSSGTKTNENGDFSVVVPADKYIQLSFTSLGFQRLVLNKLLSEGETLP